jgi:excisionase family DNA binding protein
MQKLMRVAEISVATGLARDKVYEGFRSGQLQAVRLDRTWRATEAAVEAWFAQQIHRQHQPAQAAQPEIKT